MAENSPNNSNSLSTSGLTLVHLDFHDGSKCKVWLQQDVVTRLQDGDDTLMEELRQQFMTTGTVPKSPTAKRKLDDGSVESPKKIRQSDSTIVKLVSENPELGDNYSGHNVTTYYVNTDTNEVGILEDHSGAGTVHVLNNTPATTNFGTQLVDTTLNSVDQYQCSYLEELTVGEENYIEVGPNTTFQLQDGNLVAETGGKQVIIKEERKINYNCNMQRKRKKKGLRRYMKYTVEERDEAVKLIKAGQMSQQEASRKYNIPQGTLSDYVRSGSTRWSCAICKRKYASRAALEQHHITHYEARPYLCDFCGFNTKDRATLLKHRSKRHSDMSEEYIDDHTGTVISPVPQKQTVWTPESTRDFLKEYEACLSKLDNDSLKKKYIWHMVADKMCESGHYVNARQACTKWKTMLSSYKDFKSTGGERRQFLYYTDMEEFITRNESKYHNFEDEDGQEHERVAWTHDAILQLINEYEARLDRFDSTSVKKKVLWKEIYESFKAKGYNYGFGQVQNKWKVLLRNYKTFKNNNAVAEGEGIQYFPYYEHLSRLVENRPGQCEEKFDFTILQEEQNEIQETEIITQPFLVTPESFQQAEAVPKVEKKWPLEQAETATNVPSEIPVPNEDVDDMDLFKVEAKVKVEWNDESVHLLLKEYKSLLTRFRNPMVKKKLLWQRIHKNFYSKGYCMSAAQIENKWRVLSRNYSKACSEGVSENNEVYPYVEEMKRILDSKTENPENQQTEDEEDLDYFGVDELSKVWTQSATLDLLHEYEIRVERFDDDGVKKKVLWQEIAETLINKGINVTAAQVENKWKVLLRCYKTKIGYIPVAPGKKTRDFPYHDRMNQILGERMTLLSEGSQEHGLWTHEATMLLLREYGTRLDRFDCEYIKRKEYLWQEVAIVFKKLRYTYTVSQLMNKWKSLLKKYRTVVEIIYCPETPFEKKKRKIDSFPYLVEMGQLLGHNHDISTILSVPSDGNPDDENCIKKGKKFKGKYNLEEPKTYNDVLKYLQEYEQRKEEIEQSRVQQISHLLDEKLSNLSNSEDVQIHLKEFEIKREKLEKQRMEEMLKMHKEKMTLLKSLLRTVKKKMKSDSNP